MTGALILWAALAVLFLLPFVIVVTTVRTVRGFLIYGLASTTALIGLWTLVLTMGGDSFVPGAVAWFAAMMTVSFVSAAGVRVLYFWMRT